MHSPVYMSKSGWMDTCLCVFVAFDFSELVYMYTAAFADWECSHSHEQMSVGTIHFMGIGLEWNVYLYKAISIWIYNSQNSRECLNAATVYAKLIIMKKSLLN